MNDADELQKALENLLRDHFHKLSINEQMYVSGVAERFTDLAATERFLDNAISNALKEFREIRALIERKQ